MRAQHNIHIRGINEAIYHCIFRDLLGSLLLLLKSPFIGPETRSDMQDSLSAEYIDTYSSKKKYHSKVYLEIASSGNGLRNTCSALRKEEVVTQTYDYAPALLPFARIFNI
jgi:hypothetical protein